MAWPRLQRADPAAARRDVAWVRLSWRERWLMSTRPGRRLPGASPAASASAVPPAAGPGRRHRRGNRDDVKVSRSYAGHLHIVPAAACPSRTCPGAAEQQVTPGDARYRLRSGTTAHPVLTQEKPRPCDNVAVLAGGPGRDDVDDNVPLLARAWRSWPGAGAAAGTDVTAGDPGEPPAATSPSRDGPQPGWPPAGTAASRDSRQPGWPPAGTAASRDGRQPALAPERAAPM